MHLNSSRGFLTFGSILKDQILLKTPIVANVRIYFREIGKFSGGSRISLRRCANLLFGNVFSRKLHENERNWLKRVGARVPGAPLSSITVV